jgi:hypothetical protein
MLVYTTFRITSTLKFIEEEILKDSGLRRVALHNKAYKEFIAGDHYIDEDLKITKRSAPGYVKKPVVEQTYIEEESKEELQKIAEEQGTYLATVLFQALFNYCVNHADLIPQETMEQILH